MSSEFKLGLYDRITGRNVDVTQSVVTWNHPSDMIEVGGSSVAAVKVCYIQCSVLPPQ